ncbi:MAG: hypothetical protein K8J08_09645 [Thermoanaerobaculia bacterium]|nr:hypothetical protein [Thermoanaerobaculia bacterium]
MTRDLRKPIHKRIVRRLAAAGVLHTTLGPYRPSLADGFEVSDRLFGMGLDGAELVGQGSAEGDGRVHR